MSDPTSLSVAELQQALRSRELSALEIADAYLEAAAAQHAERLPGHPAGADPRAGARGRRRPGRVRGPSAIGVPSPLLGLPVAHKDIFVTRGWRSTAGSRMLADYRSPFDAAVVERIAAAGAVCLGKLNCDEFAMGSANENPVFGRGAQPVGSERIAGGSSGGSAAAVAAGLVPFATGTDTGGSVRQPAAMCGVTGIKPTYGRVSRYGMIAYASSLDQGGVIARSAEDCALLLQAMVGLRRPRFDQPATAAARTSWRPAARPVTPQAQRVGTARRSAHRPAAGILRRRAGGGRARRRSDAGVAALVRARRGRRAGVAAAHRACRFPPTT